MALRKKRIPRYGTVQVNGHKYYRTDVEDAEGKRVILYGKTREELYDKEMAALEKVDNITFRQKSPTVAEYCEKWLLMQSVHIRNTTLTDYTSKVRRHIIKELGQKFGGLFERGKEKIDIRICDRQSGWGAAFLYAV